MTEKADLFVDWWTIWSWLAKVLLATTGLSEVSLAEGLQKGWGGDSMMQPQAFRVFFEAGPLELLEEVDFVYCAEDWSPAFCTFC